MYRNASLAEAKLEPSNFGIAIQDGLFFRQNFGVEGLALVFPRSLPIGKDRRPIWPREVADSRSESELIKLLGLYKEADYVAVRTGKLVSHDFHLTSPRDCEHLLLRVVLTRDVESAASSVIAEFASSHGALWQLHEGIAVDFGHQDDATDFWIIPTPEALRPLLNRYADEFEAEVRAADRFWRDYDARKDSIRREMETEFSAAFEQKGWAWLSRSDEAVLYYLEPDDTPQMRHVFYCDEARQQVRALLATNGKWPK